jgi:micrococcal nuclease
MYEYHIKKVLKVVDGDTIDVDIDLGFSVSFTQRVRLAGIDTPESRTKDLKEKALGLECKDFVSKKIKAATTITIKTEKLDSSEKYGRILGWVYLDNASKSLNELMIDNGYAWAYDGGTKKKDFDELLAKRSTS